MNKRAQVAIIGLWILVILTLLAISMGHRVSMALRLSRYQRDKLKAYGLAKAGINRAIVELERDLEKDKKNPPGYDSLAETWSTGKDADETPLFENIEIDEGSGETFTVKYLYDKDKDVYLCMADEERKININTASSELLTTLLEEHNVSNPTELSNNILAWRGYTVASIPDYQELGYSNKGKNFATIEELMLVKDTTPDIYNSIKELLTVYGDRININTASLEVLKILSHSGVIILNKRGITNITYAYAHSLILKINDFRDGNDNILGTQDDTSFDNIAEIVNNLKNFKTGLTTEEETVLNEIKNNFSTQSNNFKIESTGNVGQVKKKITAIVKRSTPIEIVYWHEN